MPEHVIIDGNNLYYAMHEHAPIPHIGRETLVKLLERWAHQREDKVTLVFDGPVPKGGMAKQMQSKRIEVRFSAPETADDIIVRMVHAAADPSQVHVVTSDTAIRYEARLRHCKHSDSVAFTNALFRPDHKGHESPTASPEKPDTVSPQETQEWLELFGADGDEPFDGHGAMHS